MSMAVMVPEAERLVPGRISSLESPEPVVFSSIGRTRGPGERRGVGATASSRRSRAGYRRAKEAALADPGTSGATDISARRG